MSTACGVGSVPGRAHLPSTLERLVCGVEGVDQPPCHDAADDRPLSFVRPVRFPRSTHDV
eukprot:1621643-Rhodomonas_salina.2